MGTESARVLTDSELLEAATHFITTGIKPENVSERFLELPSTSQEARGRDAVTRMLTCYAQRGKDVRPLSFAVFGPPGAGKSYVVNSILRDFLKTEDTPPVINLSQISDPKDLADAFSTEVKAEQAEIFKVFFFDEFDSPFNAAPLGWLRWFLAPMNDRKFYFNGRTIEIGKAVFIFAGGTAPSLEEFRRRAQSDPGYLDKKVPDFISRLRGFINIEGINAPDKYERTVRRTSMLKGMLEKGWPARIGPKGQFPIDPALVESLLSNAHYVHGARSMEAVLDMCQFQQQEMFTRELLPHNELLQLHLSRGPLDGKVIGISTGQKDAEAEGLLGKLTADLLGDGATLAYGGDFLEKGTLEAVVNMAKSMPCELVPKAAKRIRNYLGFPSYLNPQALSQHKTADAHVQFLRLKTLSEAEMKLLRVSENEWFQARPDHGAEGEYVESRHFAWSVSLFRMRVRLMQDVDALIVMGGKDGASWGRFPGIVEEVVLALALRKPIYVLGGRKGAAYAVGMLLGLDQTITNPNMWLEHVPAPAFVPWHAESENPFSGCFTLPGHPDLPGTIPEVRKYLTGHSLTCSGWPWNGLEREENRTLFGAAINPDTGQDCVDLIHQGLSRLEWKKTSKQTPGG
jgi:hypothetical protein